MNDAEIIPNIPYSMVFLLLFFINLVTIIFPKIKQNKFVKTILIKKIDIFKNMKLTIIIPVYNEKKTIVKVLDLVEKQVEIKKQIIVVEALHQ